MQLRKVQSVIEVDRTLLRSAPPVTPPAGKRCCEHQPQETEQFLNVESRKTVTPLQRSQIIAPPNMCTEPTTHRRLNQQCAEQLSKVEPLTLKLASVTQSAPPFTCTSGELHVGAPHGSWPAHAASRPRAPTTASHRRKVVPITLNSAVWLTYAAPPHAECHTRPKASHLLNIESNKCTRDTFQANMAPPHAPKDMQLLISTPIKMASPDASPMIARAPPWTKDELFAIRASTSSRRPPEWTNIAPP